MYDDRKTPFFEDGDRVSKWVATVLLFGVTILLTVAIIVAIVKLIAWAA